MNVPLGSCGASRYLTDATAASPPSRGDDKCVLADYNMRSSPRPTDLVMLSSTIVRGAPWVTEEGQGHPTAMSKHIYNTGAAGVGHVRARFGGGLVVLWS